MNRAAQQRTGRRRQRPTAGRRLGAAAVEFAVVAPVFFMLLVGMIEVGRAVMVQQVLINASRVGARQAVMLSATNDSVVDAVTDYAEGVGISGVDVTVSPNPATAAAGTPITVDAAINFANVSWLPAPWFMGGKTLASSSVMRKEGF